MSVRRPGAWPAPQPAFCRVQQCTGSLLPSLCLHCINTMFKKAAARECMDGMHRDMLRGRAPRIAGGIHGPGPCSQAHVWHCTQQHVQSSREGVRRGHRKIHADSQAPSTAWCIHEPGLCSQAHLRQRTQQHVQSSREGVRRGHQMIHAESRVPCDAGCIYGLGLCSQAHVLHCINRMFKAAERECVEEEARGGLRWIRYSTFVLWSAHTLKDSVVYPEQAGYVPTQSSP